MSGGPVLTLIAPVKDEEEAIAPFLARVAPILDGLFADGAWEILFVDDGSEDNTLAAILKAHAADPRVRALSLSRNFGKEAALTAGLDHAAGQAVIPIDVDLQDPPEVIGAMLAKWRDGYEVVYGVRTNRRERFPAQAPHRRPLLPRPQLSLVGQDPRACRRFPPARPRGGRDHQGDARAQPLHEGAVRLVGLPAGRGRI